MLSRHHLARCGTGVAKAPAEIFASCGVPSHCNTPINWFVAPNPSVCTDGYNAETPQAACFEAACFEAVDRFQARREMTRLHIEKSPLR
jgi:hypothetical protein